MIRIISTVCCGILLLITFNCHTLTAATGDLSRSNPHGEGVAAEGIINFIHDFESSADTIEPHSFMMLRHGKVIAEGWWQPFAPQYKHTLYSVSKTFTALAACFAIDEGRLDADDRVINFFPELTPDTISPYLRELKLIHLLTMTTVHDIDPTTRIPSINGDWIEYFLAEKLVSKPGTGGQYNSMASYVIAAIVEKVTGMPLIQYLRDKLFIPLSITDYDFEISPSGVAKGGWGLRLQTESLAKVGQFLLQKGVWNGKRLLSAEIIEQATAKPPFEVNNTDDWCQGYGYQLWQNSVDGYRMDGAYGQLVVVLPRYDAVVVMTAEGHDSRKQLSYVWKNIIPAIRDTIAEDDMAATKKLQEKLSSLSLPLPSYKRSSAEASIDGHKYTLKQNSKGIASMSFDFSAGSCVVNMQTDAGRYLLPFGSGCWHIGETAKPMMCLIASASGYRGLPNFQVAGAYTWIDKFTLELHLRYVDGVHREIFRCRFSGDDIHVTIWDSPVRSVTAEIDGTKEE